MNEWWWQEKRGKRRLRYSTKNRIKINLLCYDFNGLCTAVILVHILIIGTLFKENVSSNDPSDFSTNFYSQAWPSRHAHVAEYDNNTYKEWYINLNRNSLYWVNRSIWFRWRPGKMIRHLRRLLSLNNENRFCKLEASNHDHAQNKWPRCGWTLERIRGLTHACETLD